MFFLDLVHVCSNAKLNKNKECGLKRRKIRGFYLGKWVIVFKAQDIFLLAMQVHTWKTWATIGDEAISLHCHPY